MNKGVVDMPLRTLTPPETFEKFRSDLFEQAYPRGSINAHITVIWHDDDHFLLNWYGTCHTVSLKEIWDSRKENSISSLDTVKHWAEQTVVPTYKEALEHAVPVFNTSLSTWNFGIYRDNRLQLLPFEEMIKQKQSSLRLRCLERLNSNLFKAQQNDAVVTIFSENPKAIPACAVLFNSQLLSEVLSSVYDITESTRFLVYSSTGSSIIVGHSSAINRLSDGIEETHIVLNPQMLKTLG